MFLTAFRAFSEINFSALTSGVLPHPPPSALRCSHNCLFFNWSKKPMNLHPDEIPAGILSSKHTITHPEVWPNHLHYCSNSQKSKSNSTLLRR